MAEMLSPLHIIAVCFLYIGLLLIAALWVERKATAGRNIGNHPLIYALSLTVYNTAWTFYGSVGNAASNGMLFVTIYLGPTLAVCLWWILLRKMVRVKNKFKITDLADFISLRYNRSPSIAALVTIICLVGIVPYFALQLKAVFSTFALITSFHPISDKLKPHYDMEPIIVGLTILFALVIGVRKLVPTEGHQGVVVAVAMEGLVKLTALLAVGSYVTFGIFEGFGDIFTRFENSPLSNSMASLQATPSYYITWASYLLLSMSAVMFLPRQFHIAVVENFQEKHIATAMWLFPLYMLLINLFVLPIALGGLLAGYPVAQADTFVLALPLGFGQPVLSLLVFLGGFSAATGMIIVSSMTISTMVTNHLLLPAIDLFKALGILKRYLLQCRWITVAMLILSGYWFEYNLGDYFHLVDIGVISFAAILQLAPAIIGGLFWKKGNPAGAFFGMGAGFFLWIYTLIIPVLAKGGLISQSLLKDGPFGIGFLKPDHLFGLTGLDVTSHSVFWTLIVNISFYLFGSLYVSQREEEISISEEIVGALAVSQTMELPGEATIDLLEKKKEIQELFNKYFPQVKAVAMLKECLFALKIDQKKFISIAELAGLYNETEIHLASSIGAAAAHKAIIRSGIISSSEEMMLKQIYADIIAELKMPPSDLRRRIDFHREREKLLAHQAAEREEKIRERDNEITERKRMEEALRNSETRLAEIIEFLPDATFVIDTEGRIIIWNRAAEKFTGVKAAEMLGKGNREYSIPFYGKRRPVLIDLVLNPSEEIKRLYPNVIVENGIVMGESSPRSLKQGKSYILGMAGPLYDSKGNLIGAIESVRDITERKQAEEELKKHRDHLEDLVRERTLELIASKERAEVANQAKSTFLASMSHELRTPLNAILGYAQLLKHQENVTERQRQQLEIIRTSGEHLLTLINDILDMGKIDARRMELQENTFDLSALLRLVFDITKIRADEKKLNMQYQALTPLPKFVRGDERKLKQILLNLLTNAVKYTHQGGITLHVSYDQSAPGIFRCEVADTGIGIPQDKLEIIFEPFTQLMEEGQIREGTGLGLSITRRLLDLMQGRTGVESEPGKGSLFWVEVPLQPAASADIPEQRTEQAITRYQGGQKRIMVVDDNASNASMLVSILEPLGFEIVTTDNGSDAIDQALAFKPDLVLIDLIMPGMDGLETVQEMRAHRMLDRTRIIGISAMVMDSLGKKAFVAVCDDFIAKPITLELLLQKIGNLLDIRWETAKDGVVIPLETSNAPRNEFEAPPPEILADLYELAKRGDMQRIRAWGAKLKEADTKYGPFVEELLEMAGKFKTKAILAMVENIRERKDEP